MERAQTCLATALRQAAADATRLYDEALASSGLKVTMLRPLAIASDDPGVSISELGRKLGLDRSTMARNLKVLERGGHVVVRSGRDDRSRGVHITDHGRKALGEAMPLWRAAQKEMAARLGDERETLLALLGATRSAPTSERPRAEQGDVG